MEDYFYKIGQERGSSDCGFFAGYVAHLVDKYGLSHQIKMSKDEVYSARNGFLGNNQIHGASKFPDYNGLQVSEMIRYLGSLGTLGYQYLNFYSSKQTKYKNAYDMLRAHCPQRNKDVTLVAINTTIGGHWCTLLQSDPFYNFYDPGKFESPYLRPFKDLESTKINITAIVYRKMPIPSRGNMP